MTTCCVLPTRESPRTARSILRAIAIAVAILATGVLTGASSAAARSVTINWIPSSSSGVTHYELYVGDAPGTYGTVIDVGSGEPLVAGKLSAVVEFGDTRTHYLAMRAVDQSGLRSALSNEVVLPAKAGGNGGLPVLTQPPVAVAIDPSGHLIVVDATGAGIPIVAGLGQGGGAAHSVGCDVDGDADEDLVVGFQQPGRAVFAIFFVEQGTVVEARMIDAIAVAPSQLAHLAGIESIPACGDPDGDGRNEIVVGFGRNSRGVLLVFDDWTTDFEPLPPLQIDGQSHVQNWRWYTYRSLGGELRPALGDIDGDGRDELVLGTTREWVVVLDDWLAGFGLIAELGHAAPELLEFYASFYRLDAGSDRGTRVAVGDLDGDVADEIVVSIDRSADSYVVVLDDAIAGWESLITPDDPASTPIANWPGGRARFGLSHPAVIDWNDDGIADLLLRQSSGERALVLLTLDGGRLEMFPGWPSTGLAVEGLDLFPLSRY